MASTADSTTAAYRWDAAVAATAGSRRGRALRLALVGAAHVVLVLGLAELAAHPEARAVVKEVMARIIELPPAVEPPRPVEPPKPAPPRRHEPPPIMTAASTAAAASFAVAPQPPAPPESTPAPPAPATAIPITAAGFNADYLHNPKPVYPSASRRFGEEGRVVLRVRVSAAGLPLAVEIKQSSGFARLDDSALAAVRDWRFVPARRGDEAVDSWVSVPIVFSLQAS